MDSGPALGRRKFLAATGGAATAVGYSGAGRATLDPELERRSGHVDAVVRLEERVDTLEDVSARDHHVDRLRRHADDTQQRVVDYVEETEGVEVRRQFWLANAVSVTLDTGSASFAELAALDGVERIHRTGSGETRRSTTFEDAASVDRAATQDRTVSYGLEMMNVPEVWDRFDTRGDGATIAVIDTGVDASHPDIDLADWAEFDAAGNRVDSDSYDPDGHGTGMSSLAVGGDASGTQIGVAPEADLLVARNDPDGFFTSSLAALEWAVEKGADAVSMSFDIGPLKHEAIEAIANARAAGTVTVSAGFGPERFLSPGAIYSVLSAGAIDSERTPYRGGNGGEIRTDRYWRSDAVPDDWPDRYVTPKVVTAGVEVFQALPDNDEFDGGHTRQDGYSNAPPHVSGVVALLRSLDGSLSPDEIEQALVESAEQPGGPYENADPNGDFGHGVVNAAAAAAELQGRNQQVSGTVTDTDGAPVAGATVRAATGDSVGTDDQGRYRLSVPSGDAALTASAVGYESVTRRVSPGSGRDISFESEVRPDIQRAGRVPTRIDPGDSVTIEFDIEHVDFASLSVRQSRNLVERSAVSPRLNGEPVSVEEPINVGDASTLRLELSIEDGARGVIPLNIRLADEERNDGIELDPIHVHERPIQVAGGEDIQAAIDAAAPETTISLAGDRWTLQVEGFESPLPESRFDNPIFEQTREDRAGLVVGKPIRLVAADGHDPTLVAEGGSSGNRTFGVQVASHFATLDGIEVVADGATAAVNVLDGDGVRLRNLTLSGATNGVSAQFTKSLVVSGSRISAGRTGVALRAFSVNALVEGNTIRSARRGVFLSGRVGERTFDVDATVTGNTFESVRRNISGDGNATVRDGKGGIIPLGGTPPGDSNLDILLYAATAAAVGVLFYPYGRRRLR